jgi:alkylhydroperoxidase/carboxymuconolactone decarboxylase family protein YurZ
MSTLQAKRAQKVKWSCASQRPAAGKWCEPEKEVAALIAANLDSSALALETRSLVGLAALVARRAALPLIKDHVRNARLAGADRKAITSVVVEAALYAGFAAARDGLAAVLAVFDEEDAAREAGQSRRIG